MDYSLLVGIHDVERAEQEDVESEDNEAEEEGESDGGGIGTPPDSPSNTLDSNKPLSPGEFDPTIDVYAIKSNESESLKSMFFRIVLEYLQQHEDFNSCIMIQAPRAPPSGHCRSYSKSQTCFCQKYPKNLAFSSRIFAWGYCADMWILIRVVCLKPQLLPGKRYTSWLL